jgi:2-polyprenyl-6-methoxyphenol hydroxylase-like FAD-dependent oxidoreductase
MALPQRIAIVGAGIGGLTLAVALNKYIPAIQVKVFEQAPELRPKLGGAFKIDAGAATLRELGLLSEYLRYA